MCPDPLGPKPRGAGQVGGGPDRLPMDRCYYDPAEAGGLDPSFGSTRCGLFSHQGRPLDQLGRRHEGGNKVQKACCSVALTMSLFWALWCVYAGF